MQDFVSRHDGYYAAATWGALALTMLWEMWRPRRTEILHRAGRWQLNGLLMVISTVLVSVVVPVSVISCALYAERMQFGLSNQWNLAFWSAALLGMLLLDVAKYLQHLLMHRVPWLWRVHRTHHADFACDATTSLRFHPFEVLFAVLLEMAVVLAFGIPAAAVATYRLARIVLSTLVHGNFVMPARAEGFLRYAIVTPDLHLIHHALAPAHQCRNLGGGLIWWDRLCGTYLAAPATDGQSMPLGLSEYGLVRANSLTAMLCTPFQD